MLLRRILAHVRAENWFAVVIDLVVVVVGLFIGLQVDTWWGNRQDERREGVYLSEIQEDFELNKARLETTIAHLEKAIQNVLFLHEQAALAEPNVSAQELNDRFTSISSMPTFIPVDRAYRNLTGSGDLRLLQSRDLKNAVAEYYSAAQVTMLVQNTHEMELVNLFEPYIIDNLEYLAVATRLIDDFPLPPPADSTGILGAIQTRTFRNILTQKWVITTDLLDQHRGMLERTNKILDLLD